MGTPLNLDPFDLISFRLASEMIENLAPQRRPPRHRPGDAFIKGPIPYAWISSACRLPGVGLQVAIAYRLQAGRFALSRGKHWGVADSAKGLQVSDHSIRRGL